MAKPLNPSSDIVDRVQNFRRRRAENNRSQATLVTGIVKNIVNVVCIAGKRDAFEFARASVAIIVGFKRK